MVLVTADSLYDIFFCFIQVLILLMIGLITHQMLLLLEPYVNIPDDKIREALKVVLDPRNQPPLFLCKRGKISSQFTVCGCYPKKQLSNYLLNICIFAAPNWLRGRVLDEEAAEIVQAVTYSCFIFFRDSSAFAIFSECLL